MKASEIASFVGGRLEGPDIEVRGLSSYRDAQEGEITFVANSSWLRHSTGASVIILKEGMPPVEGKSCIFVKDPLEAVIRLAYMFWKEDYGTGISGMAVVSPKAHIGKDVVIREFAVVEDDVVLEDGVVVMPFVYIGKGSRVGEKTVLFPHVVVYPGTMIGKRCRIHAGTVLGADGFGYIERDGKRVKIPQIGRVVIGDDVEIGANTCIDRATFGKTEIGAGTKLDNLIQIGHNVKVGKDCAFAAQVGISGSVEIGDRVLMGGQVGIADHVRIGSDVKIAAKAGVPGNIRDGEVVIGGFPAIPASRWKRIYGAMLKLPEIYSLFRKLTKGERDA